jgi:catechol 2,3-dioxygenase-like lactoylglutathione lyase family enzyme
MNIHHIGLWAVDLDRLKEFYLRYFGGKSSDKYVNRVTGFESYFISFNTGSQLELMRRGEMPTRENPSIGLAHIAFSMESKDAVIELTERLRADGFTIAGEPRTTGDGYFESVVLDPEGNMVEIVY